MFNLRHLEYLRAVYQFKNFTQAAESLYISQPAISSAISALEAELNVKLIMRNSKTVLFTAEGESFMYWTDRILKLCEESKCAMRDLSDAANQQLRLGMSHAFMDDMVPKIFSTFLTAHPKAEIVLDEGSMNRHVDMLQQETLDLAYNAFPEYPESSGLITIPLGAAEIRLVLHPSHPLASLPAIPLSALGTEKLIMMDAQSKVRQLLTAAFEEAKVPMNVALHYSQILCMVGMVRACRYIGVISEAEGRSVPGCEGLVLKSFAEPLRFEVGFLMKKGRYLPKLGYELIRFMQQRTTQNFTAKEGTKACIQKKKRAANQDRIHTTASSRS